jgi:predicted amidophosphoribosyltransferase
MKLLTTAVSLVARSNCAGCRSPGGVLCHRCEAALLPAPHPAAVPGSASVVAAWLYAAAARKLVLELKVGGRRAAACPLGAALAQTILRLGSSAEVVTWVPGRRRDLRNRGFNHAEVLARAVAALLGLDARPLLERRGHRPDQAGLGAAERRANIESAFAARDSASSVLLIDDLVTTGATARACTAALRRAGAVRVEVGAACSV